MKIANKIGALGIRIGCGDPSKSQNPQDFIKKTAEAFIEILEKDKSNIDYVIQNHIDKYLSIDVAKLIKLLGNPRLGLVFSPDNCIVSQENMNEVFNTVGVVTKQIYISDLKKINSEYTEVFPGMGDVPLKDSFEAIGGVNFSGWVTFKYGKVWVDSLEEPKVSLPYFIDNYKEILG